MKAVDGCRVLIKRAHNQIQALNAEIRTFLSSHPYEVTMDRDLDTGEGVLRLKVLRDPPSLWSAIVGEIIHDLRATLDHLVWGLTEIEQGAAPDPLPRISDWRHIEFPIFDDPDAFPKAGERRLWGVSDADRTLIESYQPYHRGDRLRLWYLHELSRISKHRRLHFTCAMLQSRERYIRAVSANNARIENVEIAAERRIHDGAVLARLRVIPTGPNPKVYVEHEFTFDIAFDEGDLFGGWQLDLISQLVMLTIDVSGIVERFAPRWD